MTAPVVHHGDCIEVMRGMADNSIDAIVTDPPYGLGFMGKAWDDLPPGIDWAAECLRVLKPGGHLLAFGGTRTWHRLACAIEDAGFEIRDSIAWLYGSGFPKSLDVSKAIDKAAGAQRAVIGSKLGQPGYSLTNGNGDHRTYSKGLGNTGSGRAECDITAPATDAARQWQGWGTALKPAFEPVVCARKPLAKGMTVAANVIAHGTGALNIDATRIATTDNLNGGAYAEVGGRSESASLHAGSGMNVPGKTTGKEYVAPAGRWPANVALDEDQAAALDQMSGTLTSGGGNKANRKPTNPTQVIPTKDTGQSRFFYVAKAPAKERPKVDGIAHPTVKPIALMQWLIRLVTPPGGTVLDPFAGSGTTIEAAMLEGFDVIGIEREADYLPLIQARIDRNTYEQPDDRYGIDSFTLFDTEGETA